MVRDMNNIPADNSIWIGQRAWDDNDQTVFTFRRLNRISIRCGTRLAEWVTHSSGEIMYIVRSDLSVVADRQPRRHGPHRGGAA